MKNVYLEKIAEKKEPESKWQIGKGAAAAAAGIVGSGAVAAGATIPLSLKLESQLSNSHSSSDLGTIRKMMRDNKMNVTFNTREHSVNKHVSKNFMEHNIKSLIKNTKSPAYLSSGSKGKKDFIVGVKSHKAGSSSVANKDVIMHELGHAKDFMTNKKLKVGSMQLGRAGKHAGTAMLLNKDTRDHATTVSALSTLPTLRAEATANKHAYDAIKAHKGSGAASKFARRFVPAQLGLYGVIAAGQIGATYAGKKLLDLWDKKK